MRVEVGERLVEGDDDLPAVVVVQLETHHLALPPVAGSAVSVVLYEGLVFLLNTLKLLRRNNSQMQYIRTRVQYVL